MLIKILFIILIGLSAGGVTATGLFALISSIGLINRYAPYNITPATPSLIGSSNIYHIFPIPAPNIIISS